MADDIKIKVKLTGDNRDLNNKIDKTQKNVNDLKLDIDGIGGLASAAAFGFTAIAGAATLAVNEAAKFEGITTQFEVLTGNINDAKRAVKDLQDFSANTPFQFADIADAGKKLLGFGFAADDLKPKLKAIGDVASAVGQPIGDISLIFGQVSAAGKLTGERLLQFQERAIPIGPALAKTMGVAEKSIKDLVSKGKVDFDTFEKAFNSMSQKGGLAFNGMEKQSQTLDGKISTLKDNISLLSAAIGKKLVPEVKGATGALITAAKYWTKFFTDSEKDSQGIDRVKASLASVNSEIARLEKNIKSQSGSTLYESFLGRKDQDLKDLGNAFEERTKLLNRQKEIEKSIEQNSSKFLEQKAIETAAKKTALEQKTADSIKEIKDSAKRLDIDRNLELDTTGTDEEKLSKLQTFLENKKNIELEDQALELESKGMHDEALNILNDAYLQKKLDDLKKGSIEEKKTKDNDFKEEEALLKKKLALKKRFSSLEKSVAYNLASTLNAIGGDAAKAGFLITKALAVSNATVNYAGALAAVPFQTAHIPYPLNLAAAAKMTGLIKANYGLQLASIAASTITGFSQGGLVEGGIKSRDTMPAMLQQGELVAPRSNFEEVIGSVRAMREAQNITNQSGTNQSVDVTIGFKDNAFEIIEENLLERRVLGIGAI